MEEKWFAIPAGTSNVDFEEMEKLITIRTKMICCVTLKSYGKSIF
jgi:hypothetical protein